MPPVKAHSGCNGVGGVTSSPDGHTAFQSSIASQASWSRDQGVSFNPYPWPFSSGCLQCSTPCKPLTLLPVRRPGGSQEPVAVGGKPVFQSLSGLTLLGSMVLEGGCLTCSQQPRPPMPPAGTSTATRCPGHCHAVSLRAHTVRVES